MFVRCQMLEFEQTALLRGSKEHKKYFGIYFFTYLHRHDTLNRNTHVGAHARVPMPAIGRWRYRNLTPSSPQG